MNENQPIIIRDVETIAELRSVEELQLEVWGRSDRDVVPLTQLIAACNVGGHVLGAFDGEQLAGFAYGFIGIHSGHTVLHSHMLAIRTAYRNRNLGFRLKLAQRERVLQQGLRRMTWTFDPLQSLNANFNIAKLGVLAATYKVNVYGEATSSFLHRNGTDRLLITWLLDSHRVRRRIEERSAASSFPAEAITLLRIDDDDAPRLDDEAQQSHAPHALIEIPGDINTIQSEQPQLSLDWRDATRRAFMEAIGAGYIVREFRRTMRGERRFGTYLLSCGDLEDFSD